MELLLLLLLGGVTAGIGLWAALGDKKEKDVTSGGGASDAAGEAKSSPELPQAGDPAQRDSELGAPVVIGDPTNKNVQALKDILRNAPSQVEAKVVPEQSADAKPDHSGKSPLKVSYHTDDIISRASPYPLKHGQCPTRHGSPV